MGVTLGDKLVGAFIDGRISQVNLAVFVHLAARTGAEGIQFTLSSLAGELGIRKQTLAESLARLALIDAIVYAPAKSRYASSFISIPNRTDDSGIIGSPKRTDALFIGSPNRTDEPGPQAADQRESVSSVAQTVPMNGGDIERSSVKRSSGGRKRKTFDVDSAEIALSTLLLEKIRAELDRGIAADLQAWALEVDRLHRLDGRSYDEIEQVIEWLHSRDGGRDAEFWRGNVLSTKSLRKHFTTLMVRKNGTKPRMSKHLEESVSEFEEFAAGTKGGW